VYLGLGSNVGDRECNLKKARAELRARGLSIARQSEVRETDPWGIENQPRFLNQVVEAAWTGDARGLLKVTQDVERSLGRTATFRWGPREIDVDILMFGQQVIHEPGLDIPHARLAERRFVLEPLLELDSTLANPETGERLGELLARIGA